jgi:hypothetical protein
MRERYDSSAVYGDILDRAEAESKFFVCVNRQTRIVGEDRSRAKQERNHDADATVHDLGQIPLARRQSRAGSQTSDTLIAILSVTGLLVDLVPFYRMAGHDAKLLLLVEKFRAAKPRCFPTYVRDAGPYVRLLKLSVKVVLGVLMLSRMGCACSLLEAGPLK